MENQNEEIKNEKNDKDNISICSDNLMSTEYNTFQDKKEKGNIPDLIKNEKDLEKFLEETHKKFVEDILYQPSNFFPSWNNTSFLTAFFD